MGPSHQNHCKKSGIIPGEKGGDLKVFIEKSGEKKEAEVEKRNERGKLRFWIEEKIPQTTQEPEGREDEPTPEVVDGMQEDTPEEVEAAKKMWLNEKVTTLEKENEILRARLQQLEERMELHERAAIETSGRCGILEAAITKIAQHIEQQDPFNKSANSSISALVGEVKAHQGHFQEVAKILQNHEQFITNSGAASQEMAQYINALVQENEKKSPWICALMNEVQAQAQELQQHEMGQQVLAEMLKLVMNHRPSQHQHQTTTGTSPVVTEVDDTSGADLGFRGGPNPNEGPPDIGAFGVMTQLPQVQDMMEMAQQH